MLPAVTQAPGPVVIHKKPLWSHDWLHAVWNICVPYDEGVWRITPSTCQLAAPSTCYLKCADATATVMLVPGSSGSAFAMLSAIARLCIVIL